MSLGPEWKKSTRSGDGGSCVKARTTPKGVELGDTKAPDDAPTLTFNPEEWKSFVEDVKTGAFDL